MKMPGQIGGIKCWVRSAIFFLTISLSQIVFAHGELLIRIDAMTKRIAASNNLAPLYLERGELYREDQKWVEAEADYARAVQLDPKLTLAVNFNRAKMLEESGQLESSRAMFDKVLADSPKNGEAWIGRAQLEVKLNQPKMAEADFRSGLALLQEPKQEYFLQLARLLVSESKTNEALQTLDVAIKKYGPIVPLQLYAMELDLGQKKSESALARLDTIIERAARKETWLARRGDILLASSRPLEARKSFESSLAAIKLLPMILQKAPPMRNLESRIQAGLARTYLIQPECEF